MADVKHFEQAAVLGTVVRLFWRQGLAATGIQNVVTATGVNRSSLYATFGDKRELIRAASELALLAYGVNLRSRVGASATELRQTGNHTLHRAYEGAASRVRKGLSGCSTA